MARQPPIVGSMVPVTNRRPPAVAERVPPEGADRHPGLDVYDAGRWIPRQHPVHATEVEHHRPPAQRRIAVAAAGAAQDHRHPGGAGGAEGLADPVDRARPPDIAGSADRHAPAFQPLQAIRRQHGHTLRRLKTHDGIARITHITYRQRAGTYTVSRPAAPGAR